MATATRASVLPRHMAVALKEMKERLKKVDVALELRDARIPLTSSNPVLAELVHRRRHVVVLNKADLADPARLQPIVSQLEERGHRVVTSCALTPGSAEQVLDAVKAVMLSGRGAATTPSSSPSSSSFSSTVRSSSALPPPISSMMVVGIPNCGKSTLINSLKAVARAQGLLPSGRSKGDAAVGPLPGVTRTLGGFQVSDKPLMFVVDTPGILPLPDGMMHKHHSGRAAARGDDDGAAATKLALTGAVPDGRVTDDEQVRWLLRHLKQPYYKARMSQIVAHAAFADATSSRRERGRSGSEQRVAAAVAAAVIASDEQLLSAEPHRGGASEAVVESEEEGDSDDDGRPKPSGRAAAVASADTAAAAAARRRQQRSLTLDPTGTQLRLDHVMSLLRVDVDRGSGYDNALRRVLSCFRGGGLGRFTLDDVSEMRPAHDKQWFERD